VFENRVLPSIKRNIKIVVFKQNDCNSDGDVIKNQVDKDFQPVELGYDQRSGNLYDKISY
jgi:hypothetical protein